MTEPVRNSVKITERKTMKEKQLTSSLLQSSSSSLGSVNSGKLCQTANARIQKLASTSSERLSFIGKKEDTSEIENYHLEYSKYLLRKAQNRVLETNKKAKEESIKKCLVSLKWEFEELLDKYVKLNREIVFFETYCSILTRMSKKIEEGTEVLKVLRETEFDIIMETLSSLFSCRINQLELVDFDKKLIDDAFREKIWGSESEIEMWLKKIDSYLSKDKVEVAKIAGELVDIKKLFLENTMLRERFSHLFKIISKEIVEGNYKMFTRTVRKAFEEREKSKSKNDSLPFSLECDFGCLYPDLNPRSDQQPRFSLPNLEDSDPVMPNSSSTPQQSNKA